MKQPLAIGVEDYKSIIDKNYYYVDKSLLMKDLIDKSGSVNLFTRPRRFGKTLALSMLKTFFEAEVDKNGNVIDNSHYFKGMKIMDCGKSYLAWMGRYPVISLSLKSAKQPDFSLAFEMIKRQIMREFDRHSYVLNCDELNCEQRERYEKITYGVDEAALYTDALQFLSDCLKKYHKEKVIILLDEYDVPLENGYFRGFYDEMSDFIRSLFESALKTNENLEFAVITGCLRISRESIFTGLNNLKSISLMDNSYACYFGFTSKEVRKMLEEYKIQDKMDIVKLWYDGYLIGDKEMYNPWSVINYVDDVAMGNAKYPKPYWSNTSSNHIIRELIEKADPGVKKEIEELVAGKCIKKPVHEDITYADIYKSQDNLWNFLFFTGYLKMEEQFFEDDTIYLTLKIPNAEIRYIYRNTIKDWFQEQLKQVDFSKFYEALLKKETEGIEEFLSDQLAQSISYYDNKESFYHGYLLGILSGLAGYEIHSNKEAGLGRPDILLKPYRPQKTTVIIELKVAKQFTEMDRLCDAALKQIEDKKYALELKKEGYLNIIKYGICFCKKSCMVKVYPN
ncbi:MAG: AAA family ATPase [Lachnospiraceae bacterium]|nr:AAA family ATPase [Lachnospiraceae bacterium]